VAGFALARSSGGSLAGDALMLLAVAVCGLGYAEGAVLTRALGGWQVICWALVLCLPAALIGTLLLRPATGLPLSAGQAGRGLPMSRSSRCSSASSSGIAGWTWAGSPASGSCNCSSLSSASSSPAWCWGSRQPGDAAGHGPGRRQRARRAALCLTAPFSTFGRTQDHCGPLRVPTGPSPKRGLHPAMASLPPTAHVNGLPQALPDDPRRTLLDWLRHDLGLTGTKKGCDHGQCGACTVLVDGRRINSCLSLAALHDGDHIETIEGIGQPEALAPLQRAFVTHDGFQCGYCTPGQICSATALMAELKAGWPSAVSADVAARPNPTREELRERMSGNLCRCGAYSNIIAALEEALANETTETGAPA
jgi:xanthine dehydrogenase YagT iron-sulfur-binding subunit